MSDPMADIIVLLVRAHERNHIGDMSKDVLHALGIAVGTRAEECKAGRHVKTDYSKGCYICREPMP